MLVLVLARVQGNRAIYGVLVDTVSSPSTIQGVAGPLADVASRRRFLAGDLPADPARAVWGQRQRWAFPLLDLRAAPPALQERVPVSPRLGNGERQRPPIPATASYRQEYVRCGKATCTHCSAGAGHGPDWYAYWRESGRLHKRYVGKERPHASGG
jgi:hypothetical protein